MLRDYAHTPDALERAWRRSARHARQVHRAVRCGGDRDVEAALMGKVVGSFAILPGDFRQSSHRDRKRFSPTSWRDCRPARRTDGVDRREAIDGHSARRAGRHGALAGKGHETYQVIGREYGT